MFNPMSLQGRTILVTGASMGIGREIAVVLSQLGARVVLVARNAERLAQTIAMLEGSGHSIEIADLVALNDIPRWMKEIGTKNGPLHGVVHSAGTQMTRPLRFLNYVELDNLMHINVHVAVGLSKGFRQKGVGTPGGSLVFMASVMGLVGQAGRVAYAASKGAMIAMTRSLAVELAHEGIRVNCVAPGIVATESTEKLRQSLTPEQFAAIEVMHPLGIGVPRDVAYACAFLLADTGRWITGTSLVVDGGYTTH